MALLRRTPVRRARLLSGRRGLTASASPVTTSTGTTLKRLHQLWQVRALGYYDTVGECWYPAQFYARAMERIRYYPALPDENGEPKEVTEGPLHDLFARIRDGSGGLSELAGTYGRLQWLIGDGYLTVSQQDGDELWEFLSPLELRIDPSSSGTQAQKFRRYVAPGATPQELVEADSRDDFAPLAGNKVSVYRFWRRHPSFSQWSDSPVRGVLDLYELLLKLTLAAGSESTSRAAQQGMLYVPEELTFDPLNPEQEADDEDPDADAFMERLNDAFERAIQNPGTAAASQPLVVRGPAMIEKGASAIPMKDCIGLIALGHPDNYPESAVWDKTVTRVANGLDLPLEMIAGGAGSANHWGAWLLDEVGFRAHVAPTVVRFCNDLNTAYLRPAAEAAKIDQADQALIWFDPVEAIQHPDESTVAKDAFDRYAISWQTYRDRTGFSEDDAPDDAELTKRVEIAIRRRALINPTVAEEPVGQEQPTGETAPSQGGSGSDAAKVPPVAVAAAAGTERELRAAQILGASQFAVGRARELAGRRLARRSQSCPHCMERIHGVPRALVAATLGADQVREVLDGHAAESELVAGAGRELAEALEAMGINGGWPLKLGALVEQHALRTLYETHAPPLPSGFAATVQHALR